MRFLSTVASVAAIASVSSQAQAGPARSAGILYEVWHSEAAMTMAQVKQAGHPQLTTETVIRSNGTTTLNDVHPGAGPPWFSGDIYNVEPDVLGFYCLYRARPNPNTTKPTNPPTPYFPPPIPDCPMASAVAKRHAELLVNAGFDYVAIDITNWPQVNSATDVAVLRPIEVLMDEWLALRAEGIPTPAVAMWCNSPVAAYNDGHITTWQWLLDHVYNNVTRAPLLWRRPSQTPPPSGTPLKMTFFVPYNSFYNASVNTLIESNGGRNNVEVVAMWAMMGKDSFDAGVWGFFSGCIDAQGAMTTSMVGTGRPCGQYPSIDTKTKKVAEVSASGSYMVAQTSLPWASPGHLRGLTLQRLFDEVLATGAPDLFISSFNEHIGGRQPPSQHSFTSFNMGLPNDPQSQVVWVDTYASEFSRDLEPTVEAGNTTWRVAASCVQLYKAGQTCTSSPEAAASPCCDRTATEIWNNAWSLERGNANPTPVKPGKVTCPAGQQVDVVETHEDNGSCDCDSYCAADWAAEVSSQRPHWTGAVSFDTGTSTMCRCIQATHWCHVAANVSCGAACTKVGVPQPSNYCVPSPPLAPLGYAVTSNPALVANLTAPGTAWTQQCAGTVGSSVFCSGDPDGRQGPFMLYSVPTAVPGAIPLYRCCTTSLPKTTRMGTVNPNPNLNPHPYPQPFNPHPNLHGNTQPNSHPNPVHCVRCTSQRVDLDRGSIAFQLVHCHHQHRHIMPLILLTGYPGVGKTTCIQAMLRVLIDAGHTRSGPTSVRVMGMVTEEVLGIPEVDPTATNTNPIPNPHPNPNSNPNPNPDPMAKQVLLDFARVTLNPGESTVVTFNPPTWQDGRSFVGLSVVDRHGLRSVVPHGDYALVASVTGGQSVGVATVRVGSLRNG
eukprot:m.106713 g.106713  ORF g.106713 m.106713 type:complete len:887 (-) comp10599_c0_seq4:193-2853(-)